jgi:hypothetical protein
MMRAEPTSLFGWDYKVMRGNQCFARLDVAWFRERGEVTIDRCVYEVGREGLMSGAFTLSLGGETLASAIKPSVFTRLFEIEHDGRSYVLESASSFVRKFVLRDADGHEVGAVRPVHLVSRKAIVDLPPELPLEFQVFVTWLVIVMWKRQNEGS